MSLNEDLILTIELENQDEIEKVIKDLEKSLKLNVKSESVLPTKPPKFKKPPEPIDIINYDKAEKFINSVQRTFIKIGDEADLNPFEILPQKKLDRFIGAFKEIGVSVDAETTIGDLVPVYNKMFSEVLTGHKKEAVSTIDSIRKSLSDIDVTTLPVRVGDIKLNKDLASVGLPSLTVDSDVQEYINLLGISVNLSKEDVNSLMSTVSLLKKKKTITNDLLKMMGVVTHEADIQYEDESGQVILTEKQSKQTKEIVRNNKVLSTLLNQEVSAIEAGEKADLERLGVSEELVKDINHQKTLLNNILKISGKSGDLEAKSRYNEAEAIWEVYAARKKDDGEKDREGMKLDKLIRKYRWLQSFLLVTQNFIGMIGKSVKAFGAGIKLLTAPFVLFLNLLLIPILPLLADFSKWLMDIVMGYKGWSDENEGLAGIIGGVVMVALLTLMALPILMWLADIIKKIPIIGPLFTKMGIKGKAAIKGLIAKLKGTGGLTGALESVTTKLKGKGGLTGAFGGVKTKMAGLTTAGIPLLGAALVGLGIGVLVVNLIKAAGGFDKLSDATQGWRTSLMETEDTARSIWIDDSFLTNAIQGIGDFVNVITGDTVLTRSLANKNLAKTMKGEGGYSEGLDEVMMTGLYGPHVLRSPEGVGGYINDRTGQLITKIDESSYNIYIQNKDKSWFEIQSEIRSQKAIEGGVYS